MKKTLRLLKMALTGEEKEYTSGSINRAIFLLAVPMIFEMIMESLFALMDIIFVSRVSTEAVAVVGITEVVLMIIESLAIGIAMASTAMVARRIGEKKVELASLAAGQTIILGLIVSLPLGIATFIYAEDILRLMGASPGVITEGLWYTRLILGLNCMLFFLFLLNAIFRGAGDAAIAMRTLILANGLNIVLDPCFIFGWGPFPELGVTGAAVATSIGRGTGVAYQIFYLVTGRSMIRLTRSDLRVVPHVLKKLFRISLGGAGQFLIATASWTFMVRIIAKFGDEAVAGYTIAIRVIIFTILPAWGMANAAATLVGQNLGAGKPDRAESSVWRAAFYNMCFLLTVSVIFYIIAPWIMHSFTSEKEVIQAGIDVLRILCLGYIFFAYGMVISQAFNGAGDTRTPTAINFLCFWMVQIPLAYVLANYTSLEVAGVFWAIAISETVLAILAISLFRRGKWKYQEI